ncbi:MULTISPECIES: type I restriction endonuclease subunit R [Enterococcus]|uniref:type I restriction endonuclease subunit R n=1 Tax=Enterococcus TaxID=1350 RepID=UPI000AB3EE03|nr:MULTISPECIES: HsdR family type I site-specific deoxyribonuclease [Enterococcus]EJI7156311.1 type I restriction endonuclease subunit R [Enterococcus faecalis]ELU9008619.1 type I restriction endonuclease subunit R [Enterococcus faecalis]MDK0527013.1 HsdR family type I site-specific deoxyribonuclease [Enterococcus faecalis]MEB3136832.1 HsdR family type I site-specific deoxyribonuclease [Enterococcus faecium]QZO08868.1 HsdR family type I site-specific deoxyribonuclease [Enterococcus raffinosus]
MKKQFGIKSQSELRFEQEVVDYLTRIGGVKQWEYKAEIKTTEQLWNNFKKILEQNNQARLDEPLSATEFNQVKKIITNINTPYQAGQFLYGVNGVSEIEVDLDNGKHVFLTVFDQAQVGGGNTVYQVVNQIQRPKVVDGKPNRRFDITLLINGLPIIQIELKKALHNATEALNQMEQYIAEKQFSGIFSTLQILIAMTPFDIRYMANTTLQNFNRAFAFNWQDEETAHPVRSWKLFADKVLSIPMAHDLSTRYMVLDGTKNKESIKVMRPYQVYATKRVLDKVRKFDFKHDEGKLGYIWHTTGSGKTITSFKTAWLASRLSNVDKVIFLVDRIALTNQTADAYRAYDPIAGFEGKTGVVSDTANISDLHRKLTKKSDKNIIVTSIQKMSRYVTRDSFQPLTENVLFIVDEAHRSTGDGTKNEGMLESIRKALPNSAWVGYTGTPKFPETREIFGDLLHAYTIKEAIADKNVLGFKVEFKETIEAPADPTEEDIDDNLRGSVYDHSPEHVELVVEDIFDNWKERSNNRKYNALFTVHVGGNRASTPRAMEYFDKFMEENNKRSIEDQIKVAISFSMDTSNSSHQLKTNENLHRAIQSYNRLFGTAFDMTTVKSYTEDLARRLNKTADDGNYLDLVIVVDQLLTGFDAPELNTLYIDRTLKGGNLIQAYSRTNRIHDRDAKPQGNIVNYRWPIQNEYEMNKSFAIYSNRDSAAEQLSLDELKKDNEESGILSKSFSKIESETKEVIQKLAELTDNFIQLPPSEKAQEEVFEGLQEYNRLLNQLKQFTEDDEKNPVSVYDEPELFYDRLGITEDQEVMLTTVLANELRERRAQIENIDISQVNLEMTHIHDVTINYDYLIELIARMADEVHEDKMDQAELTKNEIDVEIAKSDSDKEITKVRNFVSKIFTKEFIFDKYPAPRDVEEMNQAMEQSQKDSNIKLYTEFVRTWGLDNSVKPKDLAKLISRHRVGQEDMDKQGELTAMMNDARTDYKEIAAAEVANLSWVKYRIEFRKAFYQMADETKKGE